MTDRLVTLAVRHRRLVLAATLLLALGGSWAVRTQPRDVVPDLSDPQIAVVVEWPGHSPTEVSEQVTRVLTAGMEGTPGAVAVRGSSMDSMSTIDVVFGSPQALEAGRAAIVARVQQLAARLPAAARVQVGPATSSTAWVVQYALFDPTHGQPMAELRRVQEQTLRPALAAVPGVAEVATVGGGVQDVRVEVRPDALRARAVATSDVIAAVGGALEGHGVASLADLEAIPVPGASRPSEGAVAVRDVARVRVAEGESSGLLDVDGSWTAVGGIVVAERTADLAPLVEEVRRVIERERARLPSGVRLVVGYDRLELVDRVGGTLLRTLAQEVGVVVLIVLIFLLDARSVLVPLVTLPLVLLSTFLAMRLGGIPATVMSLGGVGIALGMAVDADIVALESCHRHLEALGPGAAPGRTRAALLRAAGSLTPAVLTSLLITALSFLPVLAFAGETGRLLRPLVLTKTLVVASAALVTVTVAPALRDLVLRAPVRPEMANPLTRGLVRMYRPFVHFALARPALTLITAGLLVASCIPVITRLGGEFLPRIDEGDLLFMPTTAPGAPHHHLERDLRRQDGALAAFSEAASVQGKLGRADTATDLAPMSMVETTIHLRPRDEWPKVARHRWFSDWAPAPLRRVLSLAWPEETAATTSELIENMDRATRLPGWVGAWTAPVRARMDMLSTGVRTPVGIRIVAPDPSRIDRLGEAVQALAGGWPGTRSAIFESVGGEMRLAFTPDAAALARLGVDPAAVRRTVDLLLAGGEVGALELAGRRLRVRVGPEENVRGAADALREATVRAGPAGQSGSQPVSLALLGRTRYAREPAVLRSERGELCAYVYVDLEADTDPLRYVLAGRRAIEAESAAGRLALAAGERIEWAGQYQLIADGARRLVWIVPAVAILMLGLLFLQFRSVTEALLVLASVPFALVGSFWTLYLLGYSLSAPVWVGLLSVVGLAMQTGVVMVVYIDSAFHRRVREGRLRNRDDIVAAHAEGTVARLRPKLMTILTMGVGLLPLLWSEGAGSEIMRRIAAPMVGGLASSAFLTLEVLPVLYTLWRTRQLRRAARLGTTIDRVIGSAPAWARHAEGDTVRPRDA